MAFTRSVAQSLRDLGANVSHFLRERTFNTGDTSENIENNQINISNNNPLSHTGEESHVSNPQNPTSGESHVSNRGMIGSMNISDRNPQNHGDLMTQVSHLQLQGNELLPSDNQNQVSQVVNIQNQVSDSSNLISIEGQTTTNHQKQVSNPSVSSIYPSLSEHQEIGNQNSIQISQATVVSEVSNSQGAISKRTYNHPNHNLQLNPSTTNVEFINSETDYNWDDLFNPRHNVFVSPGAIHDETTQHNPLTDTPKTHRQITLQQRYEHAVSSLDLIGNRSLKDPYLSFDSQPKSPHDHIVSQENQTFGRPAYLPWLRNKFHRFREQRASSTPHTNISHSDVPPFLREHQQNLQNGNVNNQTFVSQYNEPANISTGNSLYQGNNMQATVTSQTSRLPPPNTDVRTNETLNVGRLTIPDTSVQATVTSVTTRPPIQTFSGTNTGINDRNASSNQVMYMSHAAENNLLTNTNPYTCHQQTLPTHQPTSCSMYRPGYPSPMTGYDPAMNYFYPNPHMYHPHMMRHPFPPPTPFHPNSTGYPLPHNMNVPFTPHVPSYQNGYPINPWTNGQQPLSNTHQNHVSQPCGQQFPMSQAQHTTQYHNQPGLHDVTRPPPPLNQNPPPPLNQNNHNHTVNNSLQRDTLHQTHHQPTYCPRSESTQNESHRTNNNNNQSFHHNNNAEHNHNCTIPQNCVNQMPFTLGPIEIDKFEGDFAKYREFKIKIQSILSSNQFTEPMKVIFLKKHLGDDPLEAVASFMPDDLGAYNDMWAVLDEDFGTTELGFDHHLNLLLSISDWQQCESDVDLKKLYRHISVNYAAIKHYGSDAIKEAEAAKVFILPKLTSHAASKVTKLRESGHEYNIPSILNILKNIIGHRKYLESARSLKKDTPKIPKCRKIHQVSSDTEEDDLDDTVSHVNNSVRSSRRDSILKNSSEKRKVAFEDNKQVRKQSPSPPRTSRTIARYQTPPRVPSPARFKCPFCENNNHEVDNCTLYKNRDLYWNHIQRKRWCSNCLRSGHLWKDCWREQSCKLACGREDKHVPVLCDKFYSDTD